MASEGNVEEDSEVTSGTTTTYVHTCIQPWGMVTWADLV